MYGASHDNLTAYSNVKVFEKVFNSCIKDRIFLTLALVGLLVQVGFSCSIVKILHSFSYTIVVGSILIYIAILSLTMSYFSIAAHINRMTKRWKTRQGWVCTTKVDRRRLRARTCLRIEFGNNSVEALTPLVVQEFCISRTVSFLLVSNEFGVTWHNLLYM